MKVYDRLFINYYNFYSGLFTPKRVSAVYFLSTIQLAHMVAIIAPFIGFFGLPKHGQAVTIIVFVSISLGIFNAIYYSPEKVKILLSEYTYLNDKQKEQSRFISILVTVITVVIYILCLFYANYLHQKNMNL